MWTAILQYAMAAQAQKEAGKISDKQLALLQKQLADIANVPLPELQKAVAEQLGPSSVAGIQRDEGLRAKQMEALQAYENLANSGGLSTADKIGIEEANAAADNADRRRRQSILAELAGRGQLDSGAGLVASLSSAQDAANRGRASANDAARSAERRRLEALDAMAGMSGKMRDQDFGEKLRKAQAQDEFMKWNAGARQQANAYNLGLPQQQFENQLRKEGAKAGAVGGLSNFYTNQQQQIRSDAAAKSQAIGAAGKAYGGGSSWGGGPKSEAGESPKGYDSSGTPYYSEPEEWENPWS